MKYSINLWSASPKGQDQFLTVDVESDDRAFNIAKEQWNNDLSAITIERSNGGEEWPTRWRMNWDVGREVRVVRIPNDMCVVGYHLVAPLINGDVSGIDAEDEHHLEDFIAQYPNCAWEPFEDKDGHINQTFSMCDVTGKKNMCVTIKVFRR
jgi:hypothetical protein